MEQPSTGRLFATGRKILNRPLSKLNTGRMSCGQSRWRKRLE